MKKFWTRVQMPYKIFLQDKKIIIWLLASISAGFFSKFLDVLLGKNIEQFPGSGTFYIFAITTLLPTISECVIYLIDEILTFLKERSKKEQVENQMLPYIGKTSAILEALVIFLISITLIFVMSILYIGQYQNFMWLQYIFAAISIYLAFYFFCVNRIVQSPESYSEYENKKLQNMKIQSKATTSVTTGGKEVDL